QSPGSKQARNVTTNEAAESEVLERGVRAEALEKIAREAWKAQVSCESVTAWLGRTKPLVQRGTEDLSVYSRCQGGEPAFCVSGVAGGRMGDVCVTDYHPSSIR